jgi:hypothetical protein
MSMQVSYKKQTVVIFLLLLVFLAVLEVVLRTYDYFNPRCDFLISPASKNYEQELKNELCRIWKVHQEYIDPQTSQHLSVLNINSFGFRGGEFLIEKPEETYRIFVVGGSTIFAARAPSDHHTIPGFLQSNLEEHFPNKDIEVINAGIAALTSTDELNLVQNKIIQLEPDLIIIYDGFNDVVNYPGKIKNVNSGDFIELLWKKYLAFYDTPFIAAGIIDDWKSAAFPAMFNTEFDKKAEIWKNNLETICKQGDVEGFDTIIILQPFLGTGNKSLTENEIEIFGTGVEPSGGYSLFARQLDELENSCTKTADFRNVFDNITDDIYFDRVHVNSDANKIVADKIYDLTVSIID